MPIPSKTLTDGRSIPQLGFGVFLMSETEAESSVVEAIGQGYRHIDTASFYENEEAVGRALASAGIGRDELFLTTKLWNHEQGRAESREALERSLTKLGLDHVDLYLIHWPCPANGRYVETWESLIDLRAEGLTASIGVSNFLPEHLDTIVDETGITPVVNQIELHPSFQPNDLINHCTDLGVVVESWSPLGRNQDLEHPEVLRIAEESGATPAQVILAWHLHRGFVTIPKSVRAERMAENLAAVDVRLTSAQLETIDGLDVGNRIGPDPATMEP